MTADETALRREMVDICRRMNVIGLNQGTAGNLSIRHGDGILITPSALAYDEMGPDDIVAMSFEGHYAGPRRPSSEWRFHRDILAARPETQVVLHAHPTFCTALAVQERGIPCFHYMVAVAGGNDIRCAPYACFGTQALSDAAVAALAGRSACLLGHHGLIVIGPSFAKALWLAVEVETLARIYIHALVMGEPPRLTESQMTQVHERIRALNYGAQI